MEVGRERPPMPPTFLIELTAQDDGRKVRLFQHQITHVRAKVNGCAVTLTSGKRIDVVESMGEIGALLVQVTVQKP